MPLFLEKQRYRISLILLLLISLSTSAQRVFVVSVGGVNRSYLSYSNTVNDDNHSNKPVVIILHRNGKTARDAFSKAAWKSVKDPAILVFPNAVGNQWNCNEDEALENDVEFLKLILSDTYENFHCDRNRIFILGDKSNECLGKRIKERHSKIIASFESWKEGSESDSLSMLTDIQNVISKTVSTDTLYSLWQTSAMLKKMSPIDSLRGYRLHNRLVLEVRYGGFAMLGTVKTGISDGTYTDLTDSHSFLDIHLTKWMNDSIAWFVDIGRLKVPQRQEVTTGGSVRTGGGMIIPVTIGFKYALPRIRSHPYFLLGSGMMQVMVFGGKINPGSMSSGARPNLNAEMRMVFHTTIGTGIDLRFAKRFTLGAHLRYIHSAQFESAGKVNAIRGFNLNVGLGYIINANSLKKTPFSHHYKK